MRVGRASYDVQVVHHRAPTQVEKVLAHAHIARAVALPVADVRQRVLHPYPLSELRPALRRLLAFPQLLKEPFVGVYAHALLPLFSLLRVQRSRSGHAAQIFAGKRTTPPTSKGIETPAGHLKSLRSQLSSKAVLG